MMKDNYFPNFDVKINKMLNVKENKAKENKAIGGKGEIIKEKTITGRLRKGLFKIVKDILIEYGIELDETELLNVLLLMGLVRFQALRERRG